MLGRSPRPNDEDLVSLPPPRGGRSVRVKRSLLAPSRGRKDLGPATIDRVVPVDDDDAVLVGPGAPAPGHPCPTCRRYVPYPAIPVIHACASDSVSRMCGGGRADATWPQPIFIERKSVRGVSSPIESYLANVSALEAALALLTSKTKIAALDPSGRGLARSCERCVTNIGLALDKARRRLEAARTNIRGWS